jgi:hypothetical protein
MEPHGTREDAPMDIGEQLRTLILEPIEEPLSEEILAAEEAAVEPLPVPGRVFEPDPA